MVDYEITKIFDTPRLLDHPSLHFALLKKISEAFFIRVKEHNKVPTERYFYNFANCYYSNELKIRLTPDWVRKNFFAKGVKSPYQHYIKLFYQIRDACGLFIDENITTAHLMFTERLRAQKELELELKQSGLIGDHEVVVSVREDTSEIFTQPAIEITND